MATQEMVINFPLLHKKAYKAFSYNKVINNIEGFREIQKQKDNTACIQKCL